MTVIELYISQLAMIIIPNPFKPKAVSPYTRECVCKRERVCEVCLHKSTRYA